MEREFWQNKWDKNEIGFHQDEINRHLHDFWPRLGAGDGEAVFVPLCGKSDDMCWLAGQGHPVVGVELVKKGVEAFFSERGIDAKQRPAPPLDCWEGAGYTIYQGDFFDLPPGELGGVKNFYDRASLIAMPPEMRKRYAEKLISLFPKDARGLLVTIEYDQSEMNGPPFSVSEAEVLELYGHHFEVEQVFQKDILDEQPNFKARGLSSLMDRVYLLTKNSL